MFSAAMSVRSTTAAALTPIAIAIVSTPSGHGYWVLEVNASGAATVETPMPSPPRKRAAMNVPTNYVVALSAVLFTVGVVGVLIRRNAIVIFMSIELMLNSANLLFVAFARYYGALNGQIFVFFVMAVAAAEVAVGLAPEDLLELRDHLLQLLGVELGVALDALLLLPRLVDLVEVLTLNSHDDVGEHGHEAPVGIVDEAFILSEFG